MITITRRSAFLFAGVVLIAGCGHRSDSERFVPQEDQAQRTLETTLTAWQRGQSLRPVTGSSAPAIEFVDSHRKDGQQLKTFDVLSLVPGDGPRVFVVRLTLENPAEVVTTRYVVLGVDPLWVIRAEDFDMLAHWDHPMPTK